MSFEKQCGCLSIVIQAFFIALLPLSVHNQITPIHNSNRFIERASDLGSPENCFFKWSADIQCMDLILVNNANYARS